MNPAIQALIILAIILLVFLIGREIVTWYWKINERIHLQNETNEILLEIRNHLIAGGPNGRERT
jgi:uncharacterized membrane protein YcjF (UPF0283 family)